MGKLVRAPNCGGGTAPAVGEEESAATTIARASKARGNSEVITWLFIGRGRHSFNCKLFIMSPFSVGFLWSQRPPTRLHLPENLPRKPLQPPSADRAHHCLPERPGKHSRASNSIKALLMPSWFSKQSSLIISGPLGRRRDACAACVLLTLSTASDTRGAQKTARPTAESLGQQALPSAATQAGGSRCSVRRRQCAACIRPGPRRGAVWRWCRRGRCARG